MTDIFVGISDRVLEERLKTGLTQEAFARLGNASGQTQMRYEKGQGLPKIDYLARLGSHGVDVTYILTGQRSEGSLRPDEQILLGYFARLSEHNRQIAVGMIAALSGDNSGFERAMRADDQPSSTVHSTRREFLPKG